MSDFEYCMPEDVQIDSESILEFTREVKKASLEMHGLMIIRHGKVCAEAYWDPYEADIPHVMFSFSKSLTSTAIGFACQEGLMSLDDKLVDIFEQYLPKNCSANLKKADIRSLLTMSCGHADEISMEQSNSKNWLKNFFAHEFRYEPGTMFQYNTAGTDVLAAALKRKTGLPLTEYLRSRLFEPLDMTSVTCTRKPDLSERGGSGMRMTLRDMAKFTQFCLQKGMWKGEQLLNAAWFEEASRAQISTVNKIFTNHDSNWQLGYGYQFWRCIPEGVYRADGAYGQFGIVIPDKDAVIVIQSASFDPDLLLNIVWKTLLSGMKDGPVNTSAERQNFIQHHLQTHMHIPAICGLRNRGTERKYEGAVYRASTLFSAEDMVGGVGIWLDPDNRLEFLSFSFAESSLLLHVKQSNGSAVLEAGFDGTFRKTMVGKRKYAACARWLDGSMLEVEIRDLISASGARVYFTFGEKELAARQFSTMPNEVRIDEDYNRGRIVLKREK